MATSPNNELHLTFNFPFSHTKGLPNRSAIMLHISVISFTRWFVFHGLTLTGICICLFPLTTLLGCLCNSSLHHTLLCIEMKLVKAKRLLNFFVCFLLLAFLQIGSKNSRYEQSIAFTLSDSSPETDWPLFPSLYLPDSRNWKNCKCNLLQGYKHNT